MLFRHAAVVRGHLVLAEALGQRAGHPLGHPARVDENQRGAMRFDQLAQPPIGLLPDLSRHHGFERRGWYLDCEIARALVTDVDDAALRTCSGRAGSDQEARHRLDRLLGGGEADAQQSIAAERGQTFQRKCQMSAALVRRQRMDLVDDDGAGGREHRAPG